ncbi:hypothetical protein GSI_06210 [Ganoderma sinense ZZ0214-1]|uniref:SMP-LTD domain-containing protein n=1 Tax=Ganoderma sinense ZZ0214-1 TaxID=1077348 RepID=A0A2G8SD43_9APHY|nr:hypothetical protein GSI_06210 [Ganoderma sinense ZZ0214-1]
MSLKALFYAYVLGGLTFLPLLILGAVFYTVYTSIPVGDPDPDKLKKRELQALSEDEGDDAPSTTSGPTPSPSSLTSDLNDLPRTRKGWLTVRRTFEESQTDASYVDMVRGFLDARSKDPKRSRPKDTWYVALKGTVLYLYEDESMTECKAIELGGYDVVVYPEGLQDGELFAKRNAICLKPKGAVGKKEMPGVTRDMRLSGEENEEDGEENSGRQRKAQGEGEKRREEAREQGFDASTPWFIFVRSVVEMEDWYLALVHASANPANTPTLDPLKPVYQPDDMSHLVTTLDEQPDVIPMRWLNALIGRIFFSYYRTQTLESYIIGRLMKKISKVKRPTFLTDIKVREVSVGNRAPTFSKPMLKELTKEGDASLEVHVAYKGEIRITVEATATINLGARFKTYVVKLVLALVVRKIEGNLQVKVKRPPSSRIWYAFTQMPNIEMEVEPVVSDRQITWSMILSTIESKVKEVIYESVVLPNMDDISFFESSQYQHRGGIWADASRHEQAPTLSGEQSTTAADTNTPSALSSEASKSDVVDTQRPAIPRSHSAEGVQQTTTGTSPPDAAPAPRANTVDATLSVGTSTAAKRRTWFSSAEDESSVSVASPFNATSPEEQDSRGRRLDADTLAARRSSLPNFNGVSETRDNRIHSEDVFEEARRLAPALPTRRSPSEHSRSASSRATSISSSHAGDGSDDGSDSQFANFRSKSPANGTTSPRQTAASQASTFFQTLKSRAGDKQALSNTAKETMRKWGVSWGNFRRDVAGSGQSDEVPDAGHGDQRRPDSRGSTVRPSYADVRAAVEERREPQREQRAPAQDPATPASVSRSNGASALASEPIPVPQSSSEKGKQKQRADSASPGNEIAPVDSSPASTSGAMKTGASAMTRPESPNMLERTESQVSSSSQQSAGHTLSIVPQEEDHRPPSTIHTQPLPPKTMTIPGIHASHRGEVMSMGYAPPPPAVPLEPRKAPLQSVYRLLKNPAFGSATPATRSDLAPVSQSGFTGHDQDSVSAEDASEDVSSTVTSPAPLPPRPVPPPLPPRAAPTNAHSKSEVSCPSDREPPLSSTSASPSRASAALQSIVSKDREKRASLTPPASVPSSPGQASDASRGGEAVDDSPGQESSDSADRSESLEPSSSSPSAASASASTSASGSPTPSHTPSPPTSAGRGPPPALPPRRPVRTLA